VSGAADIGGGAFRQQGFRAERKNGENIDGRRALRLLQICATKIVQCMVALLARRAGSRHSERMVPLSFAGQEMMALGEGALFLPARRALLVADLHFEKASWFATHGQMLPPYDSMATLAGLAALVFRLGAAEVWCLGDSFHDSAGTDRLPADAAKLLCTLTGELRWTWITGNHDAEPGRHFGGEVVAEALVDGLVLRHQANPAELQPEISGHFHPRFRLRLRGRSVSRRCFIATEHKMILPAFGAFTGGLDAADRAIAAATGPGATALVPVNTRLLRFALNG
jgi:hypothetical protein